VIAGLSGFLHHCIEAMQEFASFLIPRQIYCKTAAILLAELLENRVIILSVFEIDFQL
jgi:hypothetical protein